MDGERQGGSLVCLAQAVMALKGRKSQKIPGLHYPVSMSGLYLVVGRSSEEDGESA